MANKRILIVDDEPLIATMVEGWVAELGYELVGPAESIAAALAQIARAAPDAAILDLSLGDAKAYPVAVELRNRALPFAFATGYGAKDIAAEFADVPVLAKPYDFADVERVLKRLLG